MLEVTLGNMPGISIFPEAASRDVPMTMSPSVTACPSMSTYSIVCGCPVMSGVVIEKDGRPVCCSHSVSNGSSSAAAGDTPIASATSVTANTAICLILGLPEVSFTASHR